MQKKIGIITFHNSVNYGAVMQTYGLQEFLKNNGYNVEIVDYVNDKIYLELNSTIPIKYSSPKSVLTCIAKRLHRHRKANMFNAFNERNLNLSQKRNVRSDEISELSSLYDIVITGSDQVWNLNLTGNDAVYFLNFPDSKTKRVAYAVSVGDIDNVNLSSFLPEIKMFSNISVREKTLLDLLYSRYNISTALCSDPTIMAGKKNFFSLTSDRVIKNKYVFCFLMESKPGIMEVAHKLADERGWEVIDNKSSFKFFLHSKPEDFLSWIKNSEVVLTDSFHGTVFSVLFGKQFISDKYDGQKKVKSRVRDLLEILGVVDYFCEISLENYFELEKKISTLINYDSINCKLEEFSASSQKWLIKAVEGTANE